MGFYIGIGSWPYEFLYKISFWPKLAKLQAALKNRVLGLQRRSARILKGNYLDFSKSKKNRFFPLWDHFPTPNVHWNFQKSEKTVFFLCAFGVEKWSQSGKKSIFFCFLKNPDNFLSKSVPIVSVAPKLYFLAQGEVRANLTILEIVWNFLPIIAGGGFKIHPQFQNTFFFKPPLVI